MFPPRRWVLRRKLSFGVPVLPTSSVYLEGDTTRLTQAVLNLLPNGLCYSGEQGKVYLRLEHQAQTVSTQAGDSGIGLAASQLETIFDLFVQVDTRPLERGFGSGTDIGETIGRTAWRTRRSP